MILEYEYTRIAGMVKELLNFLWHFCSMQNSYLISLGDMFVTSKMLHVECCVGCTWEGRGCWLKCLEFDGCDLLDSS